MRTPSETVEHYERIMDRGGHLSTSDWHLYEGARAELLALVPVFDCEARGPREAPVLLRYKGDFERELAKIVAEFQAGRA